MDISFKWPLFILVIASLMVAALLIRGIEMFDDSHGYLDSMIYLNGNIKNMVTLPEGGIYYPSITSPANIILGSWVGKLFHAELMGLTFINIVSYILSVFFFYNTVLLIFKDKFQSILATIFTMYNYSIIRFGAGAYLVDMTGLLFFFIVLYLGTKFFYTKNEKYLYLGGLASALGLFFKEYGGIGILTILAFILLEGTFPLKKKVKLILVTSSFMLINMGYYLFIYLAKGISYFDKYGTVSREYATNQDIYRTAKVMGSLYTIGWPFFIWGIVVGFFKKIPELDEYKKIFIAWIPSALTFLAYPAYDQRTSAALIPLLSLPTTIGITRIKHRWLIYLFLALYILANFFMKEILPVFSLDSILQFVKSILY